MASLESDMFLQGAYTPEQFAMMQGIFKSIVAEPWFSQSASKQKEFALLVIHTYRRGLTEPEKLFAFCLAAAKDKFTDGGAPVSSAEQPDQGVTPGYSL